MRIKTRLVDGFMEVKLLCPGAVVELGLLHDEERRALALELEQAIDELLSGLKTEAK